MNRIAPNGKIFAIDFDGTCVTHDFPSVGQYIGAAAEDCFNRVMNTHGLFDLEIEQISYDRTVPYDHNLSDKPPKPTK